MRRLGRVEPASGATIGEKAQVIQISPLPDLVGGSAPGFKTDRKNLPLQLAGKIDWELIDGEIAPLYSDIVQRAGGIRKTRPQQHS
jgi:hypothetical protein